MHDQVKTTFYRLDQVGSGKGAIHDAHRASFTSRMRLADSEKVLAIAELSDGSFWSDSVDVVVTIAACVEDGIP